VPNSDGGGTWRGPGTSRERAVTARGGPEAGGAAPGCGAPGHAVGAAPETGQGADGPPRSGTWGCKTWGCKTRGCGTAVGACAFAHPAVPTFGGKAGVTEATAGAATLGGTAAVSGAATAVDGRPTGAAVGGGAHWETTCAGCSGCVLQAPGVTFWVPVWVASTSG